jgi:predicted Kef-type K+ transport protein
MTRPMERHDQLAMTLTRHLTPPAHGAIEFACGLAMMLAPAVLGFGAAGFVVSASLGALLAGMGLSLHTPGRDPLTSTRRAASVALHSRFDSLFVIAVALGALGLALAGDAGERRAAIFLAILAGIQAGLNLRTRYVTAG